MPYLKGSKLSDLQALQAMESVQAPVTRDFINEHVWFVCNDGSISKRHAPRIAPLDDHDLDVLLTALRHYEASPWRDMLGPPNTKADHVAAVMQYIEGLKQ